ncbi:hypothetical protein EMPS_05688 [Entomortierella parvispora]|uniref:Uncharacterized protein n=1 Tax=Entomortierella parvispora TaxID=205924 RepID=A0A9P3LX01_9FUNG|nr:hypothetical protein EMPS_05688 [Entomortierella parvispora]
MSQALIRSAPAKVALATVSALTALAIFQHILLSTPPYVDPISERCLFPPSLADEDKFMPVSLPVFDRLVCVLVPYFVDCSRTVFGRLSVQLLMAFVAPISWLQVVEASRAGNRWSMLACMPFSALFAYSTGIGIYLPLLFVPLMINSKPTMDSTASASAVPLARVYALLVVQALNIASIAAVVSPGPDSVGPERTWIPLATAINVPMEFALWFIYTPLTFIVGSILAPTPASEIEKARQDKRARQLVINSSRVFAFLSAIVHIATLAAYLTGTATPLSDFVNSFQLSFRLEHLLYAPAYFLLWDFFGAVLGSLFWVLSDAEGLKEPVHFL